MLLIPHPGEFAGNTGIGLIDFKRKGEFRWKILPRFYKILEITPFAISVQFDNYQCAFVNYDGEIISDLFLFIDEFSEGLWPIHNLNGKYGYINTKMEIVIPAQFETASIFKNGTAIVSIEEKFLKYGIINKKGEWIIPPIYSFIQPANEGFYRAAYNHELGFVSQTHEIFGFEDCGVFSEGLAAVKKNGKWGFVDTNGKLVIPYSFDNLRPPRFKEGLAAVVIDKKYGFIDKNGHIIIPPQFEDANSFSEGLAAVKLGKWGFIDRTGKVVHPFEWDNALLFSEGLCPIKKNFWGYINNNGEIVIDYQFDDAWPFTEGIAVVRFKNNDFYHNPCRYGYIDHYGNWAVPPVFEHAIPFSKNQAKAYYEGTRYILTHRKNKIFVAAKPSFPAQEWKRLTR